MLWLEGGREGSVATCEGGGGSLGGALAGKLARSAVFVGVAIFRSHMWERLTSHSTQPQAGQAASDSDESESSVDARDVASGEKELPSSTISEEPHTNWASRCS